MLIPVVIELLSLPISHGRVVSMGLWTTPGAMLADLDEYFEIIWDYIGLNGRICVMAILDNMGGNTVG